MGQSTEPRVVTALHAKAVKYGVPLAGTFELTPRCNFNCKMCYVHMSEKEQTAQGAELRTEEWLEIARCARKEGMLFLLLTGGEPLLRSDFKYLFSELKKMGFMISINSNASLIDGEWIEFFKKEPPFRFNITLYGASEETYGALCGNRSFERVYENIKMLKEIGIGVKINVSLTPYNACDLEKLHMLSQGLEAPAQATTYMFPPVRRDEGKIGENDRFSALEAARCGVMWDKLRFDAETFEKRAETMEKGMKTERGDACEGTPGEKISCRAGKSTFWINWKGEMTPCGMMNNPAVSVRDEGFSEAWRKTRESTEEIRLPSECRTCDVRHACHVCAAMCQTETGRFDGKPEYICEMTRETVRATVEAKRSGK